MRAHVRTSNRMHQSAIVLVRCVPGSFSNLRHIGKREDPGGEVGFRFGRASFADRSENYTHLCYHEVNSMVTTNCCRNGKKSRHGLCKFVLW